MVETSSIVNHCQMMLTEQKSKKIVDFIRYQEAFKLLAKNLPNPQHNRLLSQHPFKEELAKDFQQKLCIDSLIGFCGTIVTELSEHLTPKSLL